MANAVSEAVAALNESRRQAEADNVQTARRLWSEYAAILARSDAPQEGDAARLLFLMGALGRSEGALKNDEDIARKAAAHMVLVARTDEADEKRRRAKEAQQAFDKEAELRKEQLLAEWRDAYSDWDLCVQAARELERFAKMIPSMFDTSTIPPRLVTAD